MPMTVSELLAWQPPRYDWIVDHNLIVPGGKILVYGAKESFKSMLFDVDLAFKIATGNRWLSNFETRQSRVLVVQTEVPKRFLQIRVQKYMDNHSVRHPDNLMYETTDIQINRPGGHDYNILKHWVEQCEPDVLILDPLYDLLHGDLNGNVDTRNFLHLIGRVTREVNPEMATIIIHHQSKASFDAMGRRIDRGADQAFGAAALLWWCDTAFGLERSGNTRSNLTMSFDKLRNWEEGYIPDLNLRFMPQTIDFMPQVEELQGGLI